MSTPLESTQSNSLYDTALTEVVEVIPPQLPESTMIRLNVVRELMVAAWLRGVGFEQERAARSAAAPQQTDACTNCGAVLTGPPSSGGACINCS